MTNTRSSKRRRRKSRLRVGLTRIHRCFGFERLENRTVFSSDLVGWRDTIEVESEPAIVDVHSNPFRRNVVEVANTPIWLNQDDFVQLEVPVWMLNQLGNQDSYQLHVIFSENYFSDTWLWPGLESRTRLARMGQESTNHSEESTAISLPQSNQNLQTSQISEPTIVDPLIPAPKQLENPTQESRSTIHSNSPVVLASLTAKQDFDGSMRFIDWTDVPSRPDSSSEILRLPNEIRIEPRPTVPTVLPNPGATVIKTITVNRTDAGLMVSETRNLSDVTEGLGRPESEVIPSTTVAQQTDADSKQDSLDPEQRPIRSMVTLKTIDISQVRRNEPMRSWIRSRSVPNPAIERESSETLNSTRSIEAAGQPVVHSESESVNQTRRALRVSGTMLQPIEFHLADELLDHGVEAGGLRNRAFEIAMSDYSSEVPSEFQVHDWDLEWVSSTQIAPNQAMRESQSVDEPSALVSHTNEKPFSARLLGLWLSQLPISVAPNKDSWKNTVRSASETVVGQAMLASATSWAIYNRETSLFSSKTAWEFVTKPPRNSPE